MSRVGFLKLWYYKTILGLRRGSGRSHIAPILRTYTGNKYSFVLCTTTTTAAAAGASASAAAAAASAAATYN